jgi:hypothetical protein
MSRRSTKLAVASVTVFLLASVFALDGFAGTGTVVPSSGTVRAVQAYSLGPAASYSGDVGDITVATPFGVSLSSGSTYDVLVTLSMDYEAKGKGTFVVLVDATTGSSSGASVAVWPKARTLDPAQRGTVAVTFRLADVAGGVDYWFRPAVNVRHRMGDAEVDTRNVVAVVDATPTS